MSDRSKKILWIAVAVSGFALVVFLAAFLLFPPSEASESRPFDLTRRSPSKPLSPNDFSAFPSIVVQPSGESSQLPTDSQANSTSEKKSSSTVIVVPAPAANQTNMNASQTEGESAVASSAPKPASSSVSGQSDGKNSDKPPSPQQSLLLLLWLLFRLQSLPHLRPRRRLPKRHRARNIGFRLEVFPQKAQQTNCVMNLLLVA